jgi:hypothetical protein
MTDHQEPDEAGSKPQRDGVREAQNQGDEMRSALDLQPTDRGVATCTGRDAVLLAPRASRPRLPSQRFRDRACVAGPHPLEDRADVTTLLRLDPEGEPELLRRDVAVAEEQLADLDVTPATAAKENS